jgi:hypothetical protein
MYTTVNNCSTRNIGAKCSTGNIPDLMLHVEPSTASTRLPLSKATIYN